MKCHKKHCTKCDDGTYECCDDCVDVYYCHNCRDINLKELYKYFKDKYNVTDSLEEIRKLILKIESETSETGETKI
jgi:hypothetical protein